MPRLTILAPAKVNLHLAVKNKREDGFHDLESLFLALNFGDLLHFELNQGDRKSSLSPCVEISMENPMPGTGSQPVHVLDNIIYKAINLFRLSTGFSQGLKVTVEKRIPIGGGLGGGSSNAAATLLALNKIWSSQAPALSREALLEMASALGSDVPFFIHETAAAKVSGRGEIIEPVELPPMYLVLVNPGFPSDTARAFKLLDDARLCTRAGERVNSKMLHSESPNKYNNFYDSFRATEHEFYNDFVNVFPEEERSIYNEIILALKNQGAQYANLSGSGATCFGVFDDKAHAQKSAENLRGKWDFVEYCSSKKCE